MIKYKEILQFLGWLCSCSFFYFQYNGNSSIRYSKEWHAYYEDKYLTTNSSHIVSSHFKSDNFKTSMFIVVIILVQSYSLLYSVNLGIHELCFSMLMYCRIYQICRILNKPCTCNGPFFRTCYRSFTTCNSYILIQRNIVIKQLQVSNYKSRERVLELPSAI